MTDDSSSLESASVAAILARRCLEDRASMLDELGAMLADLVPSAQVDQTLLGRRLKGLRVPLGEHLFIVTRGANDAFETSRAHRVRGVIIRTDPMERMQAEAVKEDGIGIVGARVEESSWRWGANAIEFFAVGTAVATTGDAVDRQRLTTVQQVVTFDNAG